MQDVLRDLFAPFNFTNQGNQPLWLFDFYLNGDTRLDDNGRTDKEATVIDVIGETKLFYFINSEIDRNPFTVSLFI
jgi:hypothetical protein